MRRPRDERRCHRSAAPLAMTVCSSFSATAVRFFQSEKDGAVRVPRERRRPAEDSRRCRGSASPCLSGGRATHGQAIPKGSRSQRTAANKGTFSHHKDSQGAMPACFSNACASAPSLTKSRNEIEQSGEQRIFALNIEQRNRIPGIQERAPHTLLARREAYSRSPPTVRQKCTASALSFVREKARHRKGIP
jgi:hypothetical protein